MNDLYLAITIVALASLGSLTVGLLVGARATRRTATVLCVLVVARIVAHVRWVPRENFASFERTGERPVSARVSNPCLVRKHGLETRATKKFTGSQPHATSRSASARAMSTSMRTPSSSSSRRNFFRRR